jgi:hypothetical protein
MYFDFSEAENTAAEVANSSLLSENRQNALNN